MTNTTLDVPPIEAAGAPVPPSGTTVPAASPNPYPSLQSYAALRRALAGQLERVVRASALPPWPTTATATDGSSAAWTARKIDLEYRTMFNATEVWWEAFGFGSAPEAFQAFPDLVGVHKTSAGTRYTHPPPAAVPSTPSPSPTTSTTSSALAADDLVRFLEDDPSHELVGSALNKFTDAYPRWKAGGIKFKKLAADHADRLRFVPRAPGQGPEHYKIVLAGSPPSDGPRGGTEVAFHGAATASRNTPAPSAAAPSSQAQPNAPASSVEQHAAVTCLRALELEFGNRPWPNTKGQFKTFLAGVQPADHPEFHRWLASLRPERPEWSHSRRMQYARTRLLQQFNRMGCYSGTTSALTWTKGAICRVTATADAATAVLAVEHGCGTPTPTPTDADADAADIVFVDTTAMLERVARLQPPDGGGPDDLGLWFDGEGTVAICCEGVADSLHLIQVATRFRTFVFDCVQLDPVLVCEQLRGLLQAPGVTKLFHDLHSDATALKCIGKIESLQGTLDTQLAVESLTGEMALDFNQMLAELGLPSDCRLAGKVLFAERPLPPAVLRRAADRATRLLNAHEKLADVLGDAWSSVQRASDKRAFSAQETHGTRQICFDVANGYSIASLELLQEQRPSDMVAPTPLTVSDDTSILLDMLPPDFADALAGQTAQLSDINIDKGRAPHAWVAGQRVLLGGADRLVQGCDIDAIIAKLGGFGADNRAGLERQLHRISAIRNRRDDVIGLTMRVGRHVAGNAAMISDLLFADSTRSILFLGEPGSGKTTVVREATRMLAERTNICIVDTSNEIAGDGDVPHECVGLARRMMVSCLDAQAGVMIECVQNHTPDAIVIDEIGRPTEVEAARTCKQRGVRLIASAHGDLRKLVKNNKLRGLVGGIETVTLGDAQAKLEQKKGAGLRKLKSQRAGPPTFDVIVELRRGAHHEWRVVLDVGDAVDRILAGEAYKAQRRTRDPSSGALQVDLEMA